MAGVPGPLPWSRGSLARPPAPSTPCCILGECSPRPDHRRHILLPVPGQRVLKTASGKTQPGPLGDSS